MYDSPESIRAALLLTNRAVRVDAKPLTAKEFWGLVARIDPRELAPLDSDGIAQAITAPETEARRLRTLLDASTALAFEQERLLDAGVVLVSALDPRFPPLLRDRLGSACPPFLLAAGPIPWLGQTSLAIVGSRDATDAALAAGDGAARLAADAGWAVVSGLARGADQAAMDGALDAGGAVIGVPAEGLLRASRNADVRARVHAGELCIASPYAPDAPFRPGAAMGRNKIVYGLSRVAFVVSCDDGAGGTWAGAKEALDRHFAPVAVWAGTGAGEGNSALVRRGASPISEISRLLDIEPDPDQQARQRSLF